MLNVHTKWMCPYISFFVLKTVREIRALFFIHALKRVNHSWNESTTAETSQPHAQPIATDNWPAIIGHSDSVRPRAALRNMLSGMAGPTGPANFWPRDRGSHMHLRRTLFSAHVTWGQGTVQGPLKRGQEWFPLHKTLQTWISHQRNYPVLTIETVTWHVKKVC